MTTPPVPKAKVWCPYCEKKVGYVNGRYDDHKVDGRGSRFCIKNGVRRVAG